MSRSTGLYKTASRIKAKLGLMLTNKTQNHVFKALGIELSHLTPNKINQCTHLLGILHAQSQLIRKSEGKAAKARGQRLEAHLYQQRNEGIKFWSIGKRKSKGEIRTMSGTTAVKIWLKIGSDTMVDLFRRIKWKRYWIIKAERMRFITLFWDALQRLSKFSKLKSMLGEPAAAAISVLRRNHQIFRWTSKTTIINRSWGWPLGLTCLVGTLWTWVWWQG